MSGSPTELDHGQGRQFDPNPRVGRSSCMRLACRGLRPNREQEVARPLHEWLSAVDANEIAWSTPERTNLVHPLGKGSV